MFGTKFTLLISLLAALSNAVDTPVIGILFLPINSRTRLNRHYAYTSNMKWFEQLRLRWIPLYIDDPETVWKEKIRKVSGVYLTGGGAPIFTSDGTSESLIFDKESNSWAKYGKWVYDMVQEVIRINDSGVYKPIWGNCLGFESLLLALTNATIHFETALENLSVVLPVDFLNTPNKLLDSVFTPEDYRDIRTKNTYFHNHHCGFLWENCLKNEYIQENINLHASTMTITGHKVLACFTHKRYPFGAIQFHPESNQYSHRDAYPSDQDSYEMEAAIKFARVVRNLMPKEPNPMTEEEILEYRRGIKHSWDACGMECFTIIRSPQDVDSALESSKLTAHIF